MPITFHTTLNCLKSVMEASRSSYSLCHCKFEIIALFLLDWGQYVEAIETASNL